MGHQYEQITWTWALSMNTGVPTFKMRSVDINGTDTDDFETASFTGNLGSIAHRFSLAPGTYMYSSGLVDGGISATEFTGTITILPAKEFILPVQLSVKGHAATYATLRTMKKKKN